MTTRKQRAAALLLYLLAGVQSALGAPSLPLRFSSARYVGEHFFAAVAFETNEAPWVRVEVSTNMVTWTERGNVILSNRAHVMFYDPMPVSPDSHRFYRSTTPGTSPSQAYDRWRSMNLTNYRFGFMSQGSTPISGTGVVTVVNGQKTISEVFDFGTQQHTTEFDPDDFPSVIEKTAPGMNPICRVTYDSGTRVPIVYPTAAWRSIP